MSHRDIRSRINSRTLAYILLAPALLVPFWSCDDDTDDTHVGTGGTSSTAGSSMTGGTSSTAGTTMTGGGSGGMSGSGGNAGSSMTGGTGGGTGGTTVVIPDGGTDDGGVVGCALPGPDGGIDITNCCSSMCTAQAALGCAATDPNCATSCATQPPGGCEAQWTAYVACFGNEPTSAHLCFPDQGSGAPQQRIANQSVATNVFGGAITAEPNAHHCAAEECAFYECVAGPGACP